jgi:hypothetical protein
MSARRNAALGAGRFPLLAQFASGYLHQDLAVEHGTPEAARDAFLADLDPPERSAFKAEADAYRDALASRPWAEMRTAFAALGGAWRPPSRAALLRLLDVAAAATPPRPSRRRAK